jgi:hypothetical protein
MIGISAQLATDLADRGYSDAEIAQLFDPRAHKGEVRVIYARPNGDRTSPLPSSRHSYYHFAKGWVAVALENDADPVNDAEIEVSPEILEYAAQDRVAIWKRDKDQIEVSCRNARNLLARGWSFEGLASEERRRAVAEAKPVPAPKAPSSQPTEPKRK